MDNTREKLIELLEQSEKNADAKGYYNCAINPRKIEFVADHLIANGVTVQKWIPVTERLPVKESQAYEKEWAEYPMYIVMIDKAFFPNALYFDWRDSKWFDFRSDGTIYEYEVTHWMPQPEPPKGD